MNLIKVKSFLFFFIPTLSSAIHLEYQILSGDNLPLLVKRTGCKLEILKKCNPNYDFSHLQTGDTIYYPHHHIVQKGETFYSLSVRLKKSIQEIQDWNQFSATQILKQGDRLFTPCETHKIVWDYFWPVHVSPQKESGNLQAVTFDAKGQEFRSVCQGVVLYKGNFRGIGPLILVENKEKLTFAFGNFESSVIEFGQNVAKGQVLGLTKNRPGQSLYFFVFREGKALDPFKARR